MKVAALQMRSGTDIGRNIETFEAMVLPRRVTRPYRFTRLYYRVAWRLWLALATLIPPGRRRTSMLSGFGPLSLLTLFALWAAALIAGFGLVHAAVAPRDRAVADSIYLSGTTFTTLGYGDVNPAGAAGRVLSVAEAVVGFVSGCPDCVSMRQPAAPPTSGIIPTAQRLFQYWMIRRFMATPLSFCCPLPEFWLHITPSQTCSGHGSSTLRPAASRRLGAPFPLPADTTGLPLARCLTAPLRATMLGHRWVRYRDRTRRAAR